MTQDDARRMTASELLDAFRYGIEMDIETKKLYQSAPVVAARAELARRLEAGERLAKVAGHTLEIIDLQPKPKLGEWNWPQIAEDLRVALAAYKATEDSR
jgi:hypothetical protein